MTVVSDHDLISFLPFPVELLPFKLDVDAHDLEDQAHLCPKDQLLCHVNLFALTLTIQTVAVQRRTRWKTVRSSSKPWPPFLSSSLWSYLGFDLCDSDNHRYGSSGPSLPNIKVNCCHLNVHD